MEAGRYKEALETEKATVVGELEAIAHYNERTGDWQAQPAEPADDADPIDAADDTEDSIERQAQVADLETRFRNINRALKKIEHDNFGNCELCGKSIESNRLEANPAARTCIADKERESELSL